MIRDLEWEPLASRRKEARLRTMYKITSIIIHVSKSKYFKLAKETRTRGSHSLKYCIEHASYDISEYFYFPRTVRKWNSLTSDMHCAS